MTVHLGKKAPAFTLVGSDGREHSLADYAGRKVVIYFYPKDNTPGCTKESCQFRDLKAALDGVNAVVLGVSKDDVDSHRRFIEDFRLPFVLLSDPDTRMMAAYGAWGEKVSYGKTSMGTIRSTVVLDEDGRVIRHWPKVADAEAHPAEVVAFLQGR